MKKVIVLIIVILTVVSVGGLIFYYKPNNITKEEEKIPVIEETPEPPIDIPVEEEPVNKTSNGFVIEEIDGKTYIDGLLIVNKTYSLPKDYAPSNSHAKLTDNCLECIEEDVYQIYQTLKKDAQKEKVSFHIVSGYRSYKKQESIFKNKTKQGGEEYADKFSARAGYSEHQTGLAIDLNSMSTSFERTKEGIWLNNNCYKYGFIIRYPKGKKDETGYNFEPWHIRYVGKELAEKLYNNGDWITLEAYFGITSVYEGM